MVQKLNEEEGLKDKKPAVKNRLFERSSLVNLSYVSILYKESGRENKNIEVNRMGMKEKNVKESSYTNINRHKKGKKAELPKNEKPKKHHEIPRKGEKMRKLLSPRYWPSLIWARKSFWRFSCEQSFDKQQNGSLQFNPHM